MKWNINQEWNRKHMEVKSDMSLQQENHVLHNY